MAHAKQKILHMLLNIKRCTSDRGKVKYSEDFVDTGMTQWIPAIKKLNFAI